MRLPRAHRLIAAALSGLMVLTLVTVVAPRAAVAGGPSVDLPDTPSTAITTPTVDAPRPPDQASASELYGDQPASTAPPGGGGTATATSLSPSASWDVSPHTGDFTWSYPLRVPPAAGGLEPVLSLSYSSSTVDGRTSTTNNQSSWIGDGWGLEPGYIERTYGGCADDDAGGTVPPKTGDLCWRNDNATASRAGLLINESGQRWRAKSDDGSRIDRLTGVANGDDDGEHWRIITPDGTQYFYGSRPESKSTWTVPVFGDDVGEPCHGGTYDSSRCTQAWRWNLDKVVDARGNMMIYSYDVETNKYGLNLKDDAVGYVRGGYLRTIDYGLRADGSVALSGQVEFTTAGRCVPGSDCTPGKPDNWPDVPWTSNCDGATCVGNYAPTFWNTKRLTKIVTRVRGAGGLADVDSWTLQHSFPDPGDREKAGLWLKSIVHAGHVDGNAALPAVTFEGTAKPNRVAVTTGVGPLNRYRITGIVSETGGTIAVVYAAPDCVEGVSMPGSPETNTKRCYPVKWTPPGGNERTEYFHKYVVAEIVESDRYDGTSEQRTAYDYLDGAAWHWETSEFSNEDRKTYGEFRGFGRVRVRKGAQSDPAGPISEVEQRFYRGMDGDRLPGGQQRSIKVTDSRGGEYADSDWLAGTEFETATFNGVGGATVRTAITVPVVQGPNATRGAVRSYLVRPGTVTEHVALTGGQWRTTRVATKYDDRGQEIEVDDAGDVGKSDDDQCTRTSYARNDDKWIISVPYRVWTVGVRCSEEPTDTIADARRGYDGLPVGTAPTAGDLTRTEELTESGYLVTATAAFDVHGRVTSSKDALGNETRTAYTPAVGGPMTKTVVTNALGHVTSTTFAPAWGQATLLIDANLRRTETTYDALGRATAIWLPNRKRSQLESASMTFGYLIRDNGPTVITTDTINARGGYTTKKEIYDPLMRLRQVQTPAPGGGRLLTDTRFDSHGRAYFASSPYFHNSALDDKLWVASEVDKLGATMTTFDGAGRVAASAFRGGGVEKWRTTQAHDGDRVRVTPPQGGTPFVKVSDARGRTVELQQGSTPDVTRYTYTDSGQLASIVDAMGNTWRYAYDQRGNLVRSEDPDKGVVTMAYDNARRLTATTDARAVTLHTGYDALGRRTSLSQAGVTLASWSYDTAPGGKGLPATSIRHVGSAAYKTSVGSYNQLSKPLSMTVTIPEQEQTLAGNYTTELRYDYDGVLASQTMPAIGSLAAEGVVHERSELGMPTITRGGFDGQTLHYVTDTLYTRLGETARVQFGEGAKRAWQSYYYDAHTRRLDRTIADVEAPAPMQADQRYAYDPAGNITSIVDAPLNRTPDTQCFRYDYLRRLTEAWTPAQGCDTTTLGGPAAYRLAFTYDKAGNRLTASTEAGAATYTYPAAGSPRPHAVQSVSPGGSYEYDATGNTTVRPGQELQWDAEGRVSTITTATGATSFVYDANGSRLIRRTPQSTTLYLDGQELTLNRSAGTLTPTRYYAHAGKTVAVRTGGKLYWLLGDHQGTSQLAVDADTMAVRQQRRTPFGGTRGTSSSLPGEKDFVGGTRDATTALVHLGAREYDPVLGRFISVDPVMGNEPQLMNAYTYSNNSPVTFSDPTGLYCDSCDYYHHKNGESSVWSPEVQRTSFCDSCEYYSVKNNTASAWNQPQYTAAERPTVFAESEKINERVAAEQRAAEQARQQEESCKASFWCRAGRVAKSVATSSAFGYVAGALSIAGIFCPVCGVIGLAMSAVSAAVSCGDAAFGGGSWGQCAVGAAGVLVGGAGMVAARSLSATTRLGAPSIGDDTVVNLVDGDVYGTVVQIGSVGRHNGNLNVINIINGDVYGTVLQIGAIGRVSGNLNVTNVINGTVYGTSTRIRSIDETVHVAHPNGTVTFSPSGDMTITP
ncbi:RHS repeat-associated core domain-containing protein [Catellatospora sp. NPDC049133]|uniref:RHS repeat-associated core domain-containing protein n=1 Tax=Catellatospora sp. NPDC049133 TaxID=3155499 RepID=UPI0033C20579